MINFILDNILTTFFMVMVFLSLIVWIIFVAKKTGIWGLAIMAGCAVPFLLFYIFKLMNAWEEPIHAVFYSRIAILWLVGGLFGSYYLMYRSKVDEIE